MSNDPLVLGIDLGTSGVKTIAVDSTGNLVTQATSPLALSVPHAGWSEQDPRDWWEACIRSIQALEGKLPGCLRRVSGLALSGQMHGAVFLDKQGEPLRPAILWNDQRSANQCERITETIGFEQLVKLTGNRAYPGFQAPKILWVREHEPEVWGQTEMVLLPKDYVNFRFTNAFATEPSDASGTLFFDVREGVWSTGVLDALEIRQRVLPPVIESVATVGVVTKYAADETGLTAGIPVIAGGADNACGALAVGITDDRDVMLSVGTSGTVVAAASTPRVDPQARLHLFSHVLPECWYSMGVILSAGASLSWFRDTLAPDSSYEELTSEAAGVPAGSEGLLFLPYLSGERTPHADPYARGVFLGLSLQHRRGHLTRSVMEGICFAFRDSVQLMHHIGIHADRGRLTAGGAQSLSWAQMFADVLGLPMSIGLSESGPAFGAAILGGVGIGLFPSAREAADRFVKVGKQIESSPQTKSKYDRQYALYRQSYQALSEIFHRQATGSFS